MNGKVRIVGAGPGDPTFLTLRAKEALDTADVVVHDRLVSEDLLLGIKAEAKLIDVGKEQGNHPIPQEEINHILIEEARQGKQVVRLKGGDPYIFGRGGEEALALTAAGIAWEIIPGLSSALAIPALAGIPLTHRGISSSLHIITWHDKDGLSPSSEKLEALAKAGGSLAILMGASHLAEIGRALMKEGFAPHIPAAIIESGAMPRQKTTKLTLEELAIFAQKPGAALTPPVLVVVGEACSLSDRLSHTPGTNAGAVIGHLPLGGLRILVTRPEPKNAELCARIRELGGTPIPFPCIKIIPSRTLNSETIKRAISYQWIVFTSATGVEIFFGACRNEAIDFRAFSACRFAVIGKATAEALARQGFIPDYMPDAYNSRSLGEGLAEKAKPGEKVLLARSGQGASELPAILNEHGVGFGEFPLYDAIPAEGNRYAKKIIQQGRFDLAIFSSPSIVDSFAASFPSLDFARLKALCIGEPTACRAREFGMNPLIAREASSEALLELAGGIILPQGG
ncbi:uroporphyrinogen-III C-methyltransferase [Leadbettera azotonutricia]|uniref:uroporphyrinogen-III C-methyltransferase n=1 Tax=Leadbettera azotonutricia (strain ATCC BAA-888 / DSM 13862 / ZAS-9) TaxID=545695 RepID=F5YCL1_LEAAZ|nr:uroporphyrinogen-III C-methyltransferase [Leadbettera azotonutricia]AEF82068.1 uroporphyrinogen-III synthase/methyltransferase [Leadbettera azotonutricia ZAS-9]